MVAPIFLYYMERIDRMQPIFMPQPRSRNGAKNDDPTFIDVQKSILQLRVIYKEMSDPEFIKWYSKKYHIKQAAIARILEIFNNTRKEE